MDEPRKQSFITHLKPIWVVEDNEFEDDLQIWSKYIPDFDPVTSGLEGKIQQSKSPIQQWCEISVHSSMQCNKFSTDQHIFLLSDDFISEEQPIARFVDFFFEHIIMKDDFLILRERLIVLFTFITGAPHENTEEEDIIRSRVYVLLSITEMKQDSSNKKMLLSDFMIEIEILNAKIIQLYCRPSDSWNRLEEEKMNNIYFASLQRELSSIKKHARFSPVLAQLHLYLMELRFLRPFFQCFETWDDSDEETRVLLSSMVTSLQRIWGQEYDMGLLSGRLYAIRKGSIADRHPLDLELKENFQMSKQEINAWLVSLSSCSFQCRPSRSKKILMFLESILYNMSDLGAGKDVAFKAQVEILEEKLLLLKNLLKLVTNCTDSKNLEEFNILAEVFANNAACIIYLFWAKVANEDIPAKTNIMLSNMFQKIKPNTPDVARLYTGTLKAICLKPYDSLLLEQTATSFIDYFFEDLVTPWKNEFQIHRDGVIFHLTFINHHHTCNAEEVICSQLDVLFSDGVYDLLPFMIDNGTENAKITQLYCKFPDLFLYDFPRIGGQGFLDCLVQKLRNLKERMISDRNHVPFAKYKIMKIEEELISLTPIFNHVFELKELNDAWLEVVNVMYLAEFVISSCFIFYHPILHYIPFLSDVADKIKALKIKLEKIEECDMYNGICLSRSARFMSTHLEQDRTSEIYEVVVGFEVDEIIIDNIGLRLDIVSIVGMGGLGKTTIAKKIFGFSFVKSHFNIFAFSTILQNHNKRDILRDIIGLMIKPIK